MRELGFSADGTRAPLVRGYVEFPGLTDRRLEVVFLIDTGANDVTLGPPDAGRLRDHLGADVTALPRLDEGLTGFGVAPCYVADAVVEVQDRRFPLTLKIQEPYVEGGRRTPSVLGRRVLTAFTLIVAWPTHELYLR